MTALSQAVLSSSPAACALLNALRCQLTGGELADGHQRWQVARTLQPRDKYLQIGRTGSNPTAVVGPAAAGLLQTQSLKTVKHVMTPSDSHIWEGDGCLLHTPGGSMILVCSISVSSNPFRATVEFPPGAAAGAPSKWPQRTLPCLRPAATKLSLRPLCLVMWHRLTMCGRNQKAGE